MPKVTVVLPVKDGGAYVRNAVASILEQTFKDFECLIIDDGSTDGTSEFLGSLRDPRVRVLRHERNMGLTRSLIVGVQESRGEYVARMDADDIAVPERLAKQVTFLDTHPRVGLLGSACHELDGSGRPKALRRMPARDLEIRWTCLLANPFLHPTVMIRRAVLTDHALNYDRAFEAAQDYDLWGRVLMHTEGANLHEPLVYYRLTAGATWTKRDLQLRNHDRIAHRTIQRELPECRIGVAQVSRLRMMFVGGDGSPTSGGDEALVVGLYLDLLAAFAAKHARDPEVKSLEQGECVRAARQTRKVARFGDRAGLWWRLLKMHPGLPWAVIRRRLAREAPGPAPAEALPGLTNGTVR